MSKPKDDLISRAAALDAIDCWHIDFNSMDGAKVQMDCWRTIKELPAVNAVQVIRCRDCKFYHGVNEECGCNGGYHSEDWYCAGGERRDDDATLD
jgi:hypothetical protein